MIDSVSRPVVARDEAGGDARRRERAATGRQARLAHHLGQQLLGRETATLGDPAGRGRHHAQRLGIVGQRPAGDRGRRLGREVVGRAQAARDHKDGRALVEQESQVAAQALGVVG